jgi:hypothetical protein
MDTYEPVLRKRDAPLSKILNKPRLGFVKEHGKRKWTRSDLRVYWKRSEPRISPNES